MGQWHYSSNSSDSASDYQYEFHLYGMTMADVYRKSKRGPLHEFPGAVLEILQHQWCRISALVPVHWIRLAREKLRAELAENNNIGGWEDWNKRKRQIFREIRFLSRVIENGGRVPARIKFQK